MVNSNDIVFIVISDIICLMFNYIFVFLLIEELNYVFCENFVIINGIGIYWD